MQPDAKQHKDADYFRIMVKKTNMSQLCLAKKLGITDRTLRNHLKNGAPYCIQFAVECLVYQVD